MVEIIGLKKYYPIRRGVLRRVTGNIKAVNDVSFDIRRGEILGLVGESGCGKTTIGRCVVGLLKPTGGQIKFKGADITSLDKLDYLQLRRELQLIFQDPYGSLNPRMTAAAIIGEAPLYHGLVSKKELGSYVARMMAKVGLRPESGAKYPHEFSGGQRQRIGIARALAMKPSMIVCDEPVSALDLSIQSQILNLLADLRDEMSLTYLFISHDLSVVRHLSDRVAVLYLGKMVELSAKEDFFDNPLHPYSRALISAIPKIKPGGPKDRIRLRGDVPSPVNPPAGCVFSSRCPQAEERCALEEPPLKDRGQGRLVACFSVP